MKLKALSLASAQTLVPTFLKEQTQSLAKEAKQAQSQKRREKDAQNIKESKTAKNKRQETCLYLARSLY